nr:unnamed protein product [Callosobruchus analis]
MTLSGTDTRVRKGVLKSRENITKVTENTEQKHNTQKGVSETGIVKQSSPPKNNITVNKGLCFTCVTNASLSKFAIRCQRCSRTYHYECLKKYNLYVEYFICKSCQSKSNDWFSNKEAIFFIVPRNVDGILLYVLDDEKTNFLNLLDIMIQQSTPISPEKQLLFETILEQGPGILEIPTSKVIDLLRKKLMSFLTYNTDDNIKNL